MFLSVSFICTNVGVFCELCGCDVLYAVFDLYVGKFRIQIRTMLSPWNTKSSLKPYIYIFSFGIRLSHVGLFICIFILSILLHNTKKNNNWCMFPVLHLVLKWNQITMWRQSLHPTGANDIKQRVWKVYSETDESMKTSAEEAGTGFIVSLALLVF